LVEAVDASPYVVANSSGGAHRVLAQESLRDAIDNGLAIELRSKSAPDIEITGGKVSFEFGDPVDASYGVIVAPGAKNVSITGVNFHGNNMGAVLAREAAERAEAKRVAAEKKAEADRLAREAAALAELDVSLPPEAAITAPGRTTSRVFVRK